MRFFILLAVTAFMAGSNPDFRNWAQERVFDLPDPREQAAIELRCASEREAFQDDCAAELKESFELGDHEPEAILRLHCTRYTNDWASSASTPPSVCQQIYGGWIES